MSRKNSSPSADAPSASPRREKRKKRDLLPRLFLFSVPSFVYFVEEHERRAAETGVVFGPFSLATFECCVLLSARGSVRDCGRRKKKRKKGETRKFCIYKGRNSREKSGRFKGRKELSLWNQRFKVEQK